MITYDDKARVEAGSVTWNPSSIIPWNDPLGTYEAYIKPSLASELKFHFIIGDRGNIYDVCAHVDPFACTNWYWKFRVRVLKNFELRCEHSLGTSIVAPNIPDMPDIVDRTRKGLEDVFRRKIIAETIQPEDFYE